MSRRVRLALLASLAALAGVATFVAVPPAQDQTYHAFADTASVGLIPNGLNVVTNLPFLVVGVVGLLVVLSRRAAGAFEERWEQDPYVLFFSAMALTALGSAYYHWSPSDASLFWDRLPMTVAFTSLVTTVLAERVDGKVARLLFLPLVAAGLAAILAWRLTGDLRPYIFLQAGSILVILVCYAFFPSRYPHASLMAGLLAGYGAALAFETFDQPFKALLGFTGGHPLKHLAAAAGTACVAWMVWRRGRRPGEAR